MTSDEHDDDPSSIYSSQVIRSEVNAGTYMRGNHSPRHLRHHNFQEKCAHQHEASRERANDYWGGRF